jgi:hypothetical protein
MIRSAIGRQDKKLWVAKFPSASKMDSQENEDKGSAIGHEHKDNGADKRYKGLSFGRLSFSRLLKILRAAVVY